MYILKSWFLLLFWYYLSKISLFASLGFHSNLFVERASFSPYNLSTLSKRFHSLRIRYRLYLSSGLRFVSFKPRSYLSSGFPSASFRTQLYLSRGCHLDSLRVRSCWTDFLGEHLGTRSERLGSCHHYFVELSRYLLWIWFYEPMHK